MAVERIDKKPDLSSQKILVCAVGCKERRLRARTHNVHSSKRSARPTPSTLSTKGAWFREQPALSLCSDRRKEHPASAEEPQRHRRVG